MLQFSKDVVEHEVIDFYVDNKVYEPPTIVDQSELENNIDDDVQCISFSEPSVEVYNEQADVIEPNVEVNNKQVGVSEPNDE